MSRDTELLKRAFVTYVRPIVEYNTCVWSPYLLKDIQKVENVQRYFTRRLFCGCSYTYKERLFLLGRETLESRQLKYDLKMYFKLINNLVKIDSSKFFCVGPVTKGTRGHDYRLQKRMFHNNQLFNIFTNRAVDCWNALPDKIVYAKTYAVFSGYLKTLVLAEFQRGMSSEM